MPGPLRRFTAVLLIAALAVVAMTGCGTKPATGPDAAVRSEDLTPGEFPDTAPTDPVEPPPPMLRSPETAVYSYILWISYAYRTLNSDVATHAFSEWEEVRVNSYVELNRQEGRAIDQRIIEFKPTSTRTEGETATVGVTETWRYRYIDIADSTYEGPAHDVTYDSTYTVVNVPDKGWLVDKVEATARGGQPE